GYENIALGVDVRNGEGFKELDKVLDELDENNYNYSILYLDSSDEVLVKRYKETRRTHPLVKGNRIEDGIKQEREILSFLRRRATIIIDTSNMLTREFKAEMEKIFIHNKKFNNLFVTVLSFGFKYGIPSDADLVFDVRFLPNPYYIQELRPLTGNDKEIQDYVLSASESREFLVKMKDMLRFLLPNYVKEGKNNLVIAIGCTGGKHRSVTLANEIYKLIWELDYGCKIEHRDIEKDAKRKG
ncbi:MAG: RNase adapter RapZ, partial [Lachnospira sp.]|nr:RNase adapter RapZ [Lachnospira sp.]